MALRAAALAACIGRRSRSSSAILVPPYFSAKNHNPSPRGFTHRTKAIKGATPETVPPKNDSDVEQQNQNWKIKMLYDGDCPLCMREVNMLKERNKEYGTINFVDTSSDRYSSEENQGLDYETLQNKKRMEKIVNSAVKFIAEQFQTTVPGSKSVEESQMIIV